MRKCRLSPMFAACMALGLLGFGPSSQAQGKPPIVTSRTLDTAPGTASPTPPSPAMIAAAEQRGALLWRLDRAAWVTTDAFLPVWRDQPGVMLRGWVVEETGTERLVTYYGTTNGATVALARFGERNGRVTSRNPRVSGAAAQLTPAQARLVEVRERAIAYVGSPGGRQNRITSCANRAMNSVVIPTANADGSHDVYLLTPQVENHIYPMGGHHRLRVPAAFTTSCLQIQSGVPGRPDVRPEALTVSHILDPQPTEIHVFAALSLGVPVIVGIDGRIFTVERDRIRQ
jgi:hypothetical protein